eukprot:4364155-Pleurochrysis_carterae.AAC.1
MRYVWAGRCGSAVNGVGGGHDGSGHVEAAKMGEYAKEKQGTCVHARLLRGPARGAQNASL